MEAWPRIVRWGWKEWMDVSLFGGLSTGPSRGQLV